MNLDITEIRKSFPLFSSTDKAEKPLVYFDNAATKQKPQEVIDKIISYYSHENANIHRGVYQLSEQASAQYEKTRETIRLFINGADDREIVFCPSATGAINLVVHSYFKRFPLQAGDEIIISLAEHHANFVPWQQLCQETNAKLICLPVGDQSVIEPSELANKLSSKTRFVAFSAMSNVLGYCTKTAEVIAQIKKYNQNIKVLVDGAQIIASQKVDMQAMDCDFFVFSAHKLYGPTGIGCCYAKYHIWEELPPYQYGGDMIESVSTECTKFNVPPFRFEAGTPNIVGVIGLNKAVEWVERQGVNNIHKHEQDLTDYALDKLRSIPEFQLVGSSNLRRHSIISFNLANLSPLDVGLMLDKHGIAVRTGFHCAMPLLQFFNLTGCIRASFAIYNDCSEIDYFFESLQSIIKFLQRHSA